MAAAGSEFFSPPMEIFEREGHFVVRADLPGLTKDNVHVEVTDEALTIEGERRAEHEERPWIVYKPKICTNRSPIRTAPECDWRM